MRRAPRPLDFPALDLRACNFEVEKQTQQEQYSDADARMPVSSCYGGFKRIQSPRSPAMACGKKISSSDQSVNHGLHRSWSMIDIPTARPNPLRLSAGCDHFSCEDEEEKKFYQSLDPSVDYDEFDPEPPQPTRQQTARLRAGSPNNYNRSFDQNTQNFSSFCPTGGAGPAVASSPYPSSPTRRSSYDQYSSIQPRHPSTIDPELSSFFTPMAQSSPMRQPSRAPTSTRYSLDASNISYEQPRRSHRPPASMSSTRYKGLPGQPFRMPGLTPQAMPTQWMSLPGNMQSSFLEQPSIGQPRNMERSLACPRKDEDTCIKDIASFPCEVSESNEEKFPAPRCKPLDPEIAKKLCCNLPPFKIPRGTADDFICIKQREQWEALVKDQDCPGAIQSTIDGIVNFNVLALDIVFGETRLPDCLPIVEPITLLEAFCKRINYDRCQLKKLEKSAYNKNNQDDEPLRTPPPNDDYSIIEKCFKHKYTTELNVAIENLLKAEKGFNFDNPNPEVPSMNLALDKTSTDLPGIPISIQAFTGTTRPRD
ncbi:uncharacterized protein LOC129243146 isoform X1 [Anastrepha obliqua]|uniref:uncharacterized protein LOC129243146 isoform X1 n=1 Tax=Anastrepha obliqua TaxID=95512 RepID=UPI00240A42F4|nr:uncharacterized protein LOC129243146 isoform X1 [Anastrepha obliqua]